MARPQGEDGKFLSNEEAAARQNGQRRQAAVAEVAKRIATTKDEDIDVSDTHFDATMDLDPDDLHFEPTRTPSKSETVEPKTPSKAKTHSPSLLRRAKEVGLSDSEIAEYDSDTLLDLTWKLKERKEPEYRNGVHKEPARVESSKVEPKEPEKDPELDLGEYADYFTPELQGALKKSIPAMVNHALEKARKADRAEIEALKTELSQVTKYLDRRESESTAERVDRTFAEMGDEWSQVLGKGSYADVSDEEMVVRNAILARAQQMAKETDTHFLKHISAAAKALYGKFITTKSKEPPAPKRPARQSPRPADEDVELDDSETIDVDSWENAGTLRPTARRGGEMPKGKERATRKVAEMIREQRGERYHFGGGNEEDGIPD